MALGRCVDNCVHGPGLAGSAARVMELGPDGESCGSTCFFTLNKYFCLMNLQIDVWTDPKSSKGSPLTPDTLPRCCHLKRISENKRKVWQWLMSAAGWSPAGPGCQAAWAGQRKWCGWIRARPSLSASQPPACLDSWWKNPNLGIDQKVCRLVRLLALRL